MARETSVPRLQDCNERQPSMRALPALLLWLIGSSFVPASAQTSGAIAGGSNDVIVGGQPAARQGDVTSGGDALTSTSPNVMINGKPAVVQGDRTGCGGVVVGGGSNVFINGKPMARSGDAISTGRPTASSSPSEAAAIIASACDAPTQRK